jgi:hypothetical protein
MTIEIGLKNLFPRLLISLGMENVTKAVRKLDNIEDSISSSPIVLGILIFNIILNIL